MCPSAFIPFPVSCVSNAYNLVLHKYGDMLYNGLKQVVDEHLKGVAVQVAQANDDGFLQTLNDAWLDHHQSMLMIRDILMYLVCDGLCGVGRFSSVSYFIFLFIFFLFNYFYLIIFLFLFLFFDLCFILFSLVSEFALYFPLMYDLNPLPSTHVLGSCARGTERSVDCV
jgi:cullin 3